jgi:MATE family, multidrug efflux pump
MTDSNLLNKTKLLSCSIKGVLKLSFPLMISALATLFMIFVDRLFLAKYSIDTLNAAVNSGTLAWAFFGGMGMLTSMSEVFVAQYNGANDKKKIGSAVWQMIWVSIFSIFFFLPMAFWVAPIIYSNSIYASMQVDYFSTLMMFAPGYALMSALAGFFIGRGKTKLILILAVVANLINIILDKILIFGIDGFVPELGIKGAAIATCVGYLAQAIILLFIFLNSKNREKYKTNQFSFQKLAFLKALKIGAPQGVFYSLEILGWAIFFEMMTSISEFHITISAICQSIVILLSFFMDGLSKGVAAIAGNFIGAKRTIETTHILKSGFKLQVLFSSILLIFFMIDPNVTLPFFVNGQENTLLNSVESLKTLKTCFLYVLIYLTFEGFRWVISGLLSAAGDTIFLLIAGTTSVWLFLLSPIYFIVVKFKLPVEMAWLLAVFYSLFSSFIYYMRYRGGKWKEIRLIQTNSDI